MSTFTKRHYQHIASLLVSQRPQPTNHLEYDVAQLAHHSAITNALIRMFEDDNANFSRTRFLAAVSSKP